MVAKVTAEDLVRVGTKYFATLFDPTVASCAILCNTSKAEDVKVGFERLEMVCSIFLHLMVYFSFPSSSSSSPPPPPPPGP